jgi:hypothetical protein
MFRLLLSIALVLPITGCQNNDMVDEGWPCSPGRPCDNGWTCDEGVCVKLGLLSFTSDEDTGKDPTSGLTWQVTPTGGAMNWSNAQAHCTGLSLAGGGWHLPTISELRTLIRGCPGTVTGGACELTDACLDRSCADAGGCTDCVYDKGPTGGCYWPDNLQGNCDWYWSSSPVEDSVYYAWGVGFDSGYVYRYYVDGYIGHDGHVRCVRDAP